MKVFNFPTDEKVTARTSPSWLQVNRLLSKHSVLMMEKSNYECAARSWARTPGNCGGGKFIGIQINLNLDLRRLPALLPLNEHNISGQWQLGKSRSNPHWLMAHHFLRRPPWAESASSWRWHNWWLVDSKELHDNQLAHYSTALINLVSFEWAAHWCGDDEWMMMTHIFMIFMMNFCSTLRRRRRLRCRRAKWKMLDIKACVCACECAIRRVLVLTACRGN